MILDSPLNKSSVKKNHIVEEPCTYKPILEERSTYGAVRSLNKISGKTGSLREQEIRYAGLATHQVI